MSYTPNYVAAYENDSGYFTYYEPFLIPEKAFQVLEDAYCWRGRIKKRWGITQLGRLRRTFTTVTLATQANGATFTEVDLLNDTAINVRLPAAPAIPETNAEIQAGTLNITVGAVTFTDNGDGMLTGAPDTNSGTINYVTGALTLKFDPALGAPTNVVVSFSYYPALPVLGICTKEVPGQIDNDQSIFFDQKYAYQYSGGAFSEWPSIAPTTWQGPDYKQFFCANYWFFGTQEYFWVTNFNSGTAAGDPIRYYISGSWNNFTPLISTGVATNTLYSCLMLIPYKNFFVALNTWEGTTAGGQAGALNYPNRARFSNQGDPTIATAWNSTPGHGGWIDAPTTEAIIGAHLIKDVLIVKFERSSWKLVYTGNAQLPFIWQRTDAELGSESTFSMVPFDAGVFTIGNYGITTDDSVSVQRIDTQIPQQVFKINAANNGVQRISGIRDYINEIVYWAYPDSTTTQPSPSLKFPNKVLLYNYVNKTYAIFNDSFTCFGYYQPPAAKTWASAVGLTWEGYNQPWNNINQQALLPIVTAGNQDGFVLLLDQIKVKNDTSLAITAINTGATPVQITIPSHNLRTGMYVKITGIIGLGPNVLNGNTYQVNRLNENTFSIYTYNNGIFTPVPGPGGTYLGGGQVSIVNGLNIQTKIFTPTYEQAMQCRIGYMDFLFDQTSQGQVTIDVYIDENNFIPINDPASNPAMLGTNVVSTAAESTTLPIVEFQQYQAKIWHRLFLNTMCQNFFLNIYMDDATLSNESLYGNDVVLHAMCFYISPNARLTQ